MAGGGDKRCCKYATSEKESMIWLLIMHKIILGDVAFSFLRS